MPGPGGPGSVKQMSEPDGHAAAGGAFRQVIENVAAGIPILQDGRIVYVNARAARMLGREMAALVGLDPAALLSDGERHGPAGTYDAIVSGLVHEDYNADRIRPAHGRR